MNEIDELEKLEQEASTKAITDLSAKDIMVTIDKTKSLEDQAEDLVGAMATAKAVNDGKTAEDIAQKKSEELKTKAEIKLKDAQTKDIKATTEMQEAKRQKYEAVLETFGIKKHLPDYLLHIMVWLFTPIYILLTIAIGIPCGLVKVLIDNIDNILVRYENSETKNKPKIKVTVWIMLIVAIAIVVTIIILNLIGANPEGV